MSKEHFKIDHITIAGTELSQLSAQFTAWNLTPDYGGAHSNGVTHMSLLGFNDGSYIELISVLKPDTISPWWHAQIRENGGFCAWAAEVVDVAVEAERVRALGIAVEGPRFHQRARPDGIMVEWDLAYLGAQAPGAKLPFIIKDRTPRDYRVRPSKSAIDAALNGVAKIILAAADLNSSIELFQRTYQLNAPVIKTEPNLQATFADFIDTPVMLATPIDARGWLQKRLDQFGDAPCGALLQSGDIELSKKQLTIDHQWQVRQLLAYQVYWLEWPIGNLGLMGLIDQSSCRGA